MNAIFECARDGDLETLKTFSKEQIIAQVNRHKSNALHWAAGNGHLEMCKWLVSEVGIPIDYANKQLRNGLHWAARGGHQNVVNWFLDEGIPIDSLTKDGSTPLQWAVWQGQKEMCQLLLSRGANIHHKNYFHCTVAHWACMGDMNSDFLDFLEDLGVDFSQPNEMGHTPLGKAAFKGHVQHCEWLVKHLAHPDLNVGDKNGMTPAMQARNNGFIELSEKLARLADEQRELDNQTSEGTPNLESTNLEDPHAVILGDATLEASVEIPVEAELVAVTDKLQKLLQDEQN